MSFWRSYVTAVPDARNRRISVFLGGLLLMLGNLPIARVTYLNFGAVPLVYVLGFMITAGALVSVWAVFTKSDLPLWKTTAAEVILMLPVYWIIPVNQGMLMDAGLLKQPFMGLKLVMVVLAMVVPGPYLMQLVLVVSFAIEGAIVWYVLEMDAVPGMAGSGEPGFSVVFVFAIVVLILGRWRHDMLQRELEGAQARGRVLSAVARLFLRVREQSNTPLQNLRLVQKLMESGKASQADMHESMGRSLTKLEELNRTLDRYDHLVDWSGDPLEKDAAAEALLAGEAGPAKKP